MTTATVTKANKIFWLQNATRLPFLRTATVDAHTRSGKIASPEKDWQLYGYEMLNEDAARNSNKKFSRKVYYILEGDRSLAVEPAGAVYADELSGKGRKSPVAKTEAVATKKSK